MATFVFFGKYTSRAMEGMSAERTTQGGDLLEKFGGKPIAAYHLLGETDMILIADFPSMEKAMQFSVAASKLTHIRLTTAPAVSVDEFDKLIEET